MNLKAVNVSIVVQIKNEKHLLLSNRCFNPRNRIDLKQVLIFILARIFKVLTVEAFGYNLKWSTGFPRYFECTQIE